MNKRISFALFLFKKLRYGQREVDGQPRQEPSKTGLHAQEAPLRLRVYRATPRKALCPVQDHCSRSGPRRLLPEPPLPGLPRREARYHPKFDGLCKWNSTQNVPMARHPQPPHGVGPEGRGWGEYGFEYE